MARSVDRTHTTPVYRISFRREVTVTARVLCATFDAEWADAKARGLTEAEFAVESIRECDFDTLADLGSDEVSEWDWDQV